MVLGFERGTKVSGTGAEAPRGVRRAKNPHTRENPLPSISEKPFIAVTAPTPFREIV